MSLSKSRVIVLTLAAGFASLAVNIAAAGPLVETTQSIRVSYRDLDLSRPADAQKLYGRIKAAAETACGEVGNNELVLLEEHRACVRKAISDAVATVNSTRLTQIEEARDRRI